MYYNNYNLRHLPVDRGFMRAVKGYSPPADVDDRFAAVCREALPGLESGVDLKAVRLDDDAEKGGCGQNW